MAETTLYSDLIPMLLMRLPVAPDTAQMQLALSMAGRELCKRSSVWLEELPALNLVSGTDAYVLDIPYDAVVDKIAKICTRTAAQVTAGEDGGEADIAYVKYDAQTNTLTLAADANASVTSGLKVWAYLLPNLKSNELPEWIINKYGDGIVAGATWMLCRQGGKPWTNAELAVDAKRDFSDACAAAWTANMDGNRNLSVMAQAGWGFI
jgi:hypothetical protein